MKGFSVSCFPPARHLHVFGVRLFNLLDDSTNLFIRGGIESPVESRIARTVQIAESLESLASALLIELFGEVDPTAYLDVVG